ncbi:hypothetical protein Q8F55_007048 [Vanrija albida]|uniref:Uncharacterized protein n=1 Tax=Vanrija albida TaxID=181172 RepID=A0ABR3PYZ6_9TREE
MLPAAVAVLLTSRPLDLVPAALLAAVAIGTRSPTVGRLLPPRAALALLSLALVSMPPTLGLGAPLAALLAAALAFLVHRTRSHAGMNGHDAHKAPPSPLDALRAAAAPFLPRAPTQPAAHPESCFDDDFLSLLRLAHERAARRSSALAKPTPAPTPSPPAPWPKDWPVYWEGGGPAGLGRWA